MGFAHSATQAQKACTWHLQGGEPGSQSAHSSGRIQKTVLGLLALPAPSAVGWHLLTLHKGRPSFLSLLIQTLLPLGSQHSEPRDNASSAPGDLVHSRWHLNLTIPELAT